MHNQEELSAVSNYDAAKANISPDAYAVVLGLRLVANELAQLRRAVESASQTGGKE